jgi:hypothetical protein
MYGRRHQAQAKAKPQRNWRRHRENSASVAFGGVASALSQYDIGRHIRRRIGAQQSHGVIRRRLAWHRWQRLAALAMASHLNGRQPSVTLGSLAASGSGNWRKSSPEKQRQAAKIIGHMVAAA